MPAADRIWQTYRLWDRDSICITVTDLYLGLHSSIELAAIDIEKYGLEYVAAQILCLTLDMDYLEGLQ